MVSEILKKKSGPLLKPNKRRMKKNPAPIYNYKSREPEQYTVNSYRTARASQQSLE